MENTTHYSLKKPDGNDTYDVQNDNDNMDAIDAQMYANAQAASAAQSAANAAQTKANAALPSTSYTAADVLSKIKTVDGAGSGLDADTVDGHQTSTTATAGTIPIYNASGDLIGSITGNAATATKLATARTLSIAGDGTGSASFDGSANETITLTLKNSGAAAGTYTKVTVNTKGIVTAAEQLSASDVETALGFTPQPAGDYITQEDAVIYSMLFG